MFSKKKIKIMESLEKDIEINEESNGIFSSSSSSQKMSFSQSLNYDSNLEESSWSFEEEFLFFEGHYIIGNKWTLLSELFPEKHAKQMKNHFYSSIVKTLRKVLRNRFKLSLKDYIISYYSLIYVKDLFNNPKFLFSKCKKDNGKNNRNVTLKKLILNHNINLDMINNYQIKFEESLRNQIKNIYNINIDISNIRINNIFKQIIKMEILIKCYKVYTSNNLSYDDSLKICDFIKTNI